MDSVFQQINSELTPFLLLPLLKRIIFGVIVDRERDRQRDRERERVCVRERERERRERVRERERKYIYKAKNRQKIGFENPKVHLDWTQTTKILFQIQLDEQQSYS